MTEHREITRTIWISDMSGFTRSTRLTGPIPVMEKIRIMRETVSAILVRHGGDVFKLAADNIYALFDHPDTALEATRECHASLPDDLMICVGIGHGSMVQFPGERDYYGLEINIASKLGEDTAGPGETLISCDAFNLLSDEMKNDLEGPLQLEVGGSLYDYYLLPTRGGGAKDPK